MRNPHLLSIFCALALTFGLVTKANAAVINFDDIAVAISPGYSAMPVGYMGLTWDTAFYIESDTHYATLYANTYGSPSGENAASNSLGALSTSITSGTEFGFIGANFSGFAANDTLNGAFTATGIIIEGYNTGNLVDTVSMSLSTTQYDWLQADILGIDELRFISSGDFQWWLMDDLTLNQVAAPVPAAIWLFGSGLLGLIGMSRRMKT